MHWVRLAQSIVIAAVAVLATSGVGHAFQTIKDCDDCPEMVVIPTGTFIMGGKANPALKYAPEPDEVPQHSVHVQSFALGKFEVTQAEWKALMGDNPSDYISGDGSLPVESISWNEAQEYARRMSAKTGKSYRLPTEAEWEYAARAGNEGLFSFGDSVTDLVQHAWYSENSGGHIHPVGQKRPNAFGLYDMHGNVWEWVEDCYFPNYQNAPTDGSAATSNNRCSRNNRGGSWVNSAMNLRSDHRHKMGAGSSGTFIGLRLARTLK